ncbi:PH domain-containing protein [Microbacterium sp. ASV49]|uniref:PH domain-containing protein n=1 Tax=Microbacterium candidum TaxID=3041922 RepID=A0ABT7MZP3_9MICO|nr:PH domain-containing protein [Microbacterium sp. ASV49]MDL9979926.1 PH domain-containing protein [Microbacterium sp. ASV49]
MIDVDPRTQKHLISDQGEIVIDEVRKHWAALVSACLELVAGLLVACLALAMPKLWWLPVLAGAALVLHAGWRILDRRRDTFVITNMRVFRIHGILAEHIATMPLSRILDISVDKPFIGRIFGYGHFVFESAAQDQGLRDIRYVGRPDERGLTIQRVIAQAGLRGMAGRFAGHGTGTPMVPAATPELAYDTTPFDPITPFESVKPYDPDNTSTDPIRLPR